MKKPKAYVVMLLNPCDDIFNQPHEIVSIDDSRCVGCCDIDCIEGDNGFVIVGHFWNVPIYQYVVEK